MQTYIYLIAMLVTLHAIVQVAGVDTEQTQLDAQTLKIKETLHSMFDMPKRRKPVDRSKIVIPEVMWQMYQELTGIEQRESVHLPRPGLHTKSANIVRSFTHEG